MYIHTISHTQLIDYKVTVFSFLMKVKPQEVETKNTLKQSVYKTVGGSMGSQHILN